MILSILSLHLHPNNISDDLSLTIEGEAIEVHVSDFALPPFEKTMID